MLYIWQHKSTFFLSINIVKTILKSLVGLFLIFLAGLLINSGYIWVNPLFADSMAHQKGTFLRFMFTNEPRAVIPEDDFFAMFERWQSLDQLHIETLNSRGEYLDAAKYKEAARIFNTGIQKWTGNGTPLDRKGAVSAWQQAATMGLLSAEVALYGIWYPSGPHNFFLATNSWLFEQPMST